MHRTTYSGLGIGAAVAIMALLLAGCSSLTSAITSAMKPPAPEAASQGAPQPAPQEQAPSTSRSSAGSGMAYQYQFTTFYGSMWNIGWMGYADSSYKAGQGTICRFSGSGDPVTFERALLKVNPDSTQWWRFKLETKKDSILYEFLVGTDGKAQKVRYKDPDTGTVEEFVPTEDTRPASAPTKSRAEMAKYKVDRQTITVEAGTFPTDHYVYQDDNGGGTSESWTSASVPGSVVKSVYTRKKDKKASTLELIQIESGVKTVLGSF